VHSLLAPDRLTLLLVADPTRTEDDPVLEAVARRAEQEDQVAVRTLAARPAVAAALGAQHGTALLVRPDGYLVCRARPGHAEHLLEHAALVRTAATGSEAPAGRDLERTDTR
jgi:hypothetical protein